MFNKPRKPRSKSKRIQKKYQKELKQWQAAHPIKIASASPSIIKINKPRSFSRVKNFKTVSNKPRKPRSKSKRIQKKYRKELERWKQSQRQARIVNPKKFAIISDNKKPSASAVNTTEDELMKKFQQNSATLIAEDLEAQLESHGLLDEFLSFDSHTQRLISNTIDEKLTGKNGQTIYDSRMAGDSAGDYFYQVASEVMDNYEKKREF